jgi:hypothetical protein
MKLDALASLVATRPVIISGFCLLAAPDLVGTRPDENPTGKRFRGGCGAPLTGGVPPEKPSTAATPDSPAAPSAERCQLTVMFCDLVGSTELAARLDPEGPREVIAAYHRCVATTVARSTASSRSRWAMAC